MNGSFQLHLHRKSNENPVKMHHRKQRSGTGTTTPTNGRSPRAESESMGKLRFVKKPLCLQYNVSSQCARRHQFYKSKPKDQSFLMAIIVCLVRLACWIDSFVRNEVWHFLTAPASELSYISQPSGDEFSKGKLKARRKTRTRSSACSRFRRGIWAHSMASESLERRAYRYQLCY
ncbi:hypothetical protein V3C99_015870 [Haemonchus contortus]|uniref:Transmembrane protein n=1 Tax=Haemonchus contortus TaxID=6289 RepID=A0A7I4YX03_HAECO